MRITSLLAIFVFIAVQPMFSQSDNSIISDALQLRSQHFENATPTAVFESLELSQERESDIMSEVENAQFFTVDPRMFDNILEAQPEVLLIDLPIGEKGSVRLKLYKRKLYAEKPTIKKASQGDPPIENGSHSVHYWGKVEGRQKSLSSMSFSSTGIMGMISFDQQTWELGQLLDDHDTYILFNVADLKIDLPFECEVSGNNTRVKRRQEIAESVVSNPDNCVRVYVEVDHDIYLNKGSVPAATNYVEGLFNEVFILYANESVNATISELFVWDTPSPYSGSGSGDYLNDFRDHLNSSGGYNGDLAHLVNLENYGGVAWLDVLCSSSFGYAYSGINSSYQNVPNYSWSVNVVAHEMGHNIGSPHTHDCSWNGNSTPIDCCGPEKGYSGGGCGSGFSCNIPLPNQGTTMSYCHLVSGVGIDLNEGFHPQVGTLLQNEVYNSSCLTPCSTVPLVALFDYPGSEFCVNTSTQFTDQSTGDIVSWDWTFPGGTPSSSSLQNPTITYNQQGVFDVTLIVTDVFGNTSELTVNDAITVLGLPVSDFTFSENGRTVSFTNLSSQATDHSWDFGDGNSSTLENPVHTYSQDGVYTVELSSYNICGSDTHVEDVTAAVPPVAEFTASPSTGCEPLEVQFDGGLTFNATTYYWEFEGGDPATSTEMTPTATYNTDGTYDVFFVASNDYYSDTVSYEDYITVNPLPESGFSHQVNEATVEFTNTSVEYTSLEYDFGDGNSSTDEDPVHTYSTDDIYTVSLFATNNCGTDTFSTDITISTLPIAGFQASDSLICAQTSITFDAGNSSNNATGYYWEFEGGSPSTSSEESKTVAYNTAGTFDVMLVAMNANGSDTLLLSDYVTVEPLPQSVFSYFKNGLTINYYSDPVDHDNLLWDFGDGNTSTIMNPVHTYTNSGLYDVSLIAMNDCGNDTLTQTVEVQEALSASFSSQQQSGCPILEVEFTGSGNIPSGVDYNWTFEGGDPASSNMKDPVVSYSTPGSFDVMLIVSEGNQSDTLLEEDYIFVKEIPSGGFNYSINGRTVDFNLSAMNYSSLRWHFGDGNESSNPQPIHTYDSDGEYDVILELMNECDTLIISQMVEVYTPPQASFETDTMSGCGPLLVQFENSSSPNAHTFEWTFEGGSPSTSNIESPSVEYNTAGIYDVELIVSSNGGMDTFFMEDFIEVLPDPTADFDFEIDSNTGTFTNLSSGADSFHWDFGDGNISTLMSPVHTYINSGSYEVNLIAMNDCGNDTLIQSVEVQKPLSASFSSQQQSGCPILEVEFTGSGNIPSGVDYNWTFEGGDPANSNMKDPVVSYSTPGSFDVMLIVSEGNQSDTLLEEDYIFVKELPSGNFDYTINGRTVDFTMSAMNFSSFRWHFGDGNESSNAQANHTYDSDGEYDVSLELMNECDTLVLSQTVEVATPPQASFQTDTMSGCGPLLVQFENSSSPNAHTFEWTFEGGSPSTSNIESPSVEYNTAGIYDVELIVTSNGGMDTFFMEDFIEVLPDPTADFDFEIDSNTVTFTNLSSEADSFHWDFGDGNVSADLNPVHTYLNDGSYTITLQVFNDCNSSVISREIGTGSIPAANFSVVEETEGCTPFTVQFMNESSLNADSFEWVFEGGNPSISTEENPVVTYDSAGTYSVQLRVSNPLGENTLIKDDLITVNVAPLGDFEYLSDSLEVAFSVIVNDPEAEVIWEFGDGSSSTEIEPTHLYTASGNYEVLFIVRNECGADTTVRQVFISTTSLENDYLSAVLLYPNPSRQYFIVENAPREARMKIVDAFGKVFWEQRMQSSREKVNAISWPSGMYYIHITYRNQREVFKWLLQE